MRLTPSPPSRLCLKDSSVDPTLTTLFKTCSLNLLYPALFFNNFYHRLASFMIHIVYCLSPLVNSMYHKCLEHSRPSKIFVERIKLVSFSQHLSCTSSFISNFIVSMSKLCLVYVFVYFMNVYCTIVFLG